MDVTFLVTYFAHPGLLDVCLDSINRYHPNSDVIVSRQIHDEYENANKIIDKYNVSNIIEHEMRTLPWVEAAIGLAKKCETDIAVYIEHDAFLLRNIDDMIKRIVDKTYDAIGVEEMIPFSGLERNSPGMMNQNFFMIDMKKMKSIGLEKMRIDGSKIYIHMKNMESGYGISQSLDSKLFMPVERSGYAFGTYYGDVAHHLWYGSYKKRNLDIDNINKGWMDFEATRIIKDYWEGNINNNETSHMHSSL